MIYNYMTQYTREVFDGKANPSRNMANGKPFRNRSQKIEARKTAKLCSDGAYRSTAPVSYHPAPRK